MHSEVMPLRLVPALAVPHRLMKNYPRSVPFFLGEFRLGVWVPNLLGREEGPSARCDVWHGLVGDDRIRQWPGMGAGSPASLVGVRQTKTKRGICGWVGCNGVGESADIESQPFAMHTQLQV